MKDIFAEGKLQELDGVGGDGCVDGEQEEFLGFVCAKVNCVVLKSKISLPCTVTWNSAYRSVLAQESGRFFQVFCPSMRSVELRRAQF